MVQLFRRFLSPDDDAQPANPDAAASDATPARVRRIPTAAPDFSRLAIDVAAAWKKDSTLTLKWTTQQDFETAANAFATTVQTRIDTGALRPGYTYSFEELEDKMGEGLPEVKVYIMSKYKRAGADAQLPRFGLMHRHRAWILPTDHDELKLSLASMVKALGEDGFTTQEYGKTYWSDIQTAFNKALDNATANAGNVSKLVGDKKVGRAYLNKALVAITNLLEANYPDTFEEEARAWGFQKEKN